MTHLAPASKEPQKSAIADSCAAIAPTFPLDRFIAVNPYWGLVSQPIEVAALRLARLCGSSLLMKRSWYRERWERGSVTRAHLQAALERSGTPASVDDLIALVGKERDDRRGVSLLTHLADEVRDVGHHGSWASFVTHGISQLCASYFDAGQAAWSSGARQGLYAAWRAVASADRGAGLLMSCDLRSRVAQLPDSYQELIDEALRELAVPPLRVASYLTALLLDINGWAAWCAYRRFDARLRGGDDDAIVQLLAVRLAWELLLLRSGGGGEQDSLSRAWATAVLRLPEEAAPPRAAEDRTLDWVWQSALEVQFQEELAGRLKTSSPSSDAATPSSRVVFCIDVRSEPFRRALEASDPGVRTSGFAGFFGLPIDYAPLGTQLVQPQLPGLLAARLRVADVAVSTSTTGELTTRREERLGAAQSFTAFQKASTSAFAFVESLGLAYAWKLVHGTLGLSTPQPHERVGLTESESRQLRPRLVGSPRGEDLGLRDRVDLVYGILKAASLTQGFARLVVFAGHGSTTTNNPHAAGLDCGACSGQRGGVNARVLAALLNDPSVREGLKAKGVSIPDTTYFLGAMHDTTTDQFELYDVSDLPDSHREDLARLERALERAGELTRAERAPALGLSGDAEALLKAVQARSRDWSELRAEWGLVDNAAFVVAPRSRTAAVRLDGRVFLHDYDHNADDGFAVLELIMTAPMVVTNWINMQYYASTVDAQRYGSGNKVLHNVVGGNLGVFEGNGGDLRIGLPLQSVHDGREFRHTPLRLSVFIEAPRHAIEGIIERHPLVRQLVDNQWLHLFRLEEQRVEQRRGGAWQPI